ncbi:hypothetical protein MMC12_002859 [Toensbergia leucococca]|nr:hypothetical protein [Toensbergia leucococca]
MFEFLKLPQEIRDEIYRCALVRNSIEVEIVDASESKSPVHLRTTWKESTSKRYRSDAVPWETSTYQIMTPGQKHRDPIGLNLFLANRRIYDECSQIFYKENQFVFRYDIISLGLEYIAFLHDRPHKALLHFRYMHIHIGESEIFPIFWWLRPNLSWPWGSMCDGLSRSISLKQLRLSISGVIPDVRVAPWRTAPSWPDTYGEEGHGPEAIISRAWLEELLKIGGLEQLVIDVRTTCTVEESIALVTMLRSKMLDRGNQRGEDEIQVERKPLRHCQTGEELELMFTHLVAK